MRKRIIIFCDESISEGKFFSNFYGGALIEEALEEKVTDALKKKKSELNLKGEVKFSKITENYQEKYVELMKEFFKYIADGSIKIRIMFTQNLHIAVEANPIDAGDRYFKLYYQLIKHAFGLVYAEGTEPLSLRINFDKFPQSGEKISNFKGYLAGLQHSSEFRKRLITIDEQDLAEVDSNKHEILQCLDIILGLIQFRLNKGHLTRDGETRRSKRTKAKSFVYKAVYNEIKKLYPGYSFNSGISTKASHELEFRWHGPYTHWLFVPRNRRLNENYRVKD